MKSSDLVVLRTLTTGTSFRVKGIDGSSLASHPTTWSAGKSSSMKNFSFPSFDWLIFLAVKIPDLVTNSTVSCFTRTDVNRKWAAASVAWPQRST